MRNEMSRVLATNIQMKKTYDKLIKKKINKEFLPT